MHFDSNLGSQPLIVVTVFLFGTMIGSFLNVCIARIPDGKSVIRPPSHCPKCQNSIRFYDNIPILSYLMLLGRCRSCGERVSPRYLFVEALTGFLAAILVYHFGLGLAFFTGFVFVAALIVISFIDLDVRIVPDVISLPGIVAGLLFSLVARFFISDPSEVIPTPLSALIGILAGGGSLFAVAWIYERVTGVDGMGGGDIKLLAMIGAFLGWHSIPFTIFLASLAGSVVGLGLMITTGSGRRLALPFAPFLCFGATLHLFFGRELVAIYFN
ncbi:MAG: A24 family peptidase [Deltaproteobacteria bacterium]|nr:A24 family peptidase [Deltaproteobacteria bacterium]